MATVPLMLVALILDLSSPSLNVGTSDPFCFRHLPEEGGHFVGVVGCGGGFVWHADSCNSFSSHDGESANEHRYVPNLIKSRVDRRDQGNDTGDCENPDVGQLALDSRDPRLDIGSSHFSHLGDVREESSHWIGDICEDTV
jgi:hypothetical protein